MSIHINDQLNNLNKSSTIVIPTNFNTFTLSSIDIHTNVGTNDVLDSIDQPVVLSSDDVNNNIVMDLFCGTGTIGQILASRASNTKIIVVDITETAIEDAIKNAKRNKIDGLKFYTSDVGKFLKNHPEYNNKIRTIILDPARSGIAPKTLLKIININADRIVYVSCNPATQARDTVELKNHGYIIKKISLIDQFPHTSHIETVVLFEKTIVNTI